MNKLLEKLKGGSLNSDGNAGEVANEVLRHPERIDQLAEGIWEVDDIVRSRTAHAMEHISRIAPDWFYEHIDMLVVAAREDKIPAVRWHMAMIFGNVSAVEKCAVHSLPVLLDQLSDESVFVRSWAVASLTLIAERYHDLKKKILPHIEALQHDKSKAVQKRVEKALHTLMDDKETKHAGWIM
jgi:hypothetical protein